MDFKDYKFSKKAKEVMELAAEIAMAYKHGFIGTEHLLAALSDDDFPDVRDILIKNGYKDETLREYLKLNNEKSKKKIKSESDFSPKLVKVLRMAGKIAGRFDRNAISTEDLICALCVVNDTVAIKILSTIKFNGPAAFVECFVAQGVDRGQAAKEFKAYAKGKSSSATPTLDKFSRDLTKLAEKGQIDPVVGRDEEIERVMQILSRRMKNNPCLVGEPGVGKTAVVEGLALRIISGAVPAVLRNKRIVSWDMSSMVAGTKYRGEFEERITKIIKEVSGSPDTILFVDELHTLIGAGSAEGSLDASNILKPALSRGELQLIGATTRDEYRKYIEKDAAFERRFQPVYVEEPSVAETLNILEGIKGKYEEFHGVKISEEACVAACELSNRYINDRFLPDKAIDLIDEACSRKKLGLYTKSKSITKLEISLKDAEEELINYLTEEDFIAAGDKEREIKKIRVKLERAHEKELSAEEKSEIIITEDDVAGIVSTWTKVPVSKLTESESSRLLKLESILHKRVVSQDEAVKAVSKAIRRGRAGLKDPKRPIGSFMFLGPTGVGKTELSKALAEAMFGDENSLIRVDMSEYMEKHSVSKMIGSPPGYVGFDEGGQLVEQIRKNPYSVVLFDEIEKAHPDVFNMLLQLLDDGMLTDSKGRKVNFKNTIVILTSNVGAREIMDPKRLGFSAVEDAESDHKNMKDKVMEEVKRTFKPEFINRIDDIIVFRALSKEDIKNISSIMLKTLKLRVKEQMDINLTYGDKLKSFIFDKGYDKKFGARPLRRTIQTEVEDELADALLRGDINRGDTVSLSVKDGKVAFSVK